MRDLSFSETPRRKVTREYADELHMNTMGYAPNSLGSDDFPISGGLACLSNGSKSANDCLVSQF
jgi:hypothetical protein